MDVAPAAGLPRLSMPVPASPRHTAPRLSSPTPRRSPPFHSAPIRASASKPFRFMALIARPFPLPSAPIRCQSEPRVPYAIPILCLIHSRPLGITFRSSTRQSVSQPHGVLVRSTLASPFLSNASSAPIRSLPRYHLPVHVLSRLAMPTPDLSAPFSSSPSHSGPLRKRLDLRGEPPVHAQLFSGRQSHNPMRRPATSSHAVSCAAVDQLVVGVHRADHGPLVELRPRPQDARALHDDRNRELRPLSKLFNGRPVALLVVGEQVNRLDDQTLANLPALLPLPGALLYARPNRRRRERGSAVIVEVEGVLALKLDEPGVV